MNKETLDSILGFFKDNGYSELYVYLFFITLLFFWRLPVLLRFASERHAANKDFALKSEKQKEKLKIEREKRLRKANKDVNK